jgi:hypothetical protein
MINKVIIVLVSAILGLILTHPLKTVYVFDNAEVVIEQNVWGSDIEKEKVRDMLSLEILLNRLLTEKSNNGQPLSEVEKELISMSKDLDNYFKDRSVNAIMITGAVNYEMFF